MTVIITPSPLSGTINAIPSKSDAHRAFICAALAESPSIIHCSKISKDIEATIECLKKLSAVINNTDGFYRVIPVDRQTYSSVLLDCGESGSTLRFLLPVVSALGRRAVISGSGRLPNRPLTPLIEQLNTHGALVNSSFPLECRGRLSAGTYTIAGNISSQFISGLLFATPLTGGDCNIVLTTLTESKPYIDMTKAVMNKYGVAVEETEKGYFVKGGQIYTPPEMYTVEGDWSNSAFWLTCGALSGNGIACRSLLRESLQGDKAVTDILSRFGANTKISENEAFVSPAKLREIEIDASDIPDLVPVLAVAACAAEGTTRIYNAARLRLKESDRLEAVTDTLSKLGAEITQTEDGLLINGTGKLKGGRADALGDHRIAMSLAVAACICESEVIIENAEAVEKSYPAFFNDYSSLGGKIRIF